MARHGDGIVKFTYLVQRVEATCVDMTVAGVALATLQQLGITVDCDGFIDMPEPVRRAFQSTGDARRRLRGRK